MNENLSGVTRRDFIRTGATAIAGVSLRASILAKAGEAPAPQKMIGIQIGAIIEGAFITEQIFFWPGIGRLAVQAIPSGDYPVVQGVVLVSAFSYMLTTLVVDVLYAWFDPRISYETASA